MANVLIKMDLSEYADLIADRICSMWCQNDYQYHAQIVDMIEDIFGYGEDVEVGSVMEVADNFWINGGGHYFSPEDIVSGFKENNLDIGHICDHLGLEVETSEDEYIEEDYEKALVNYLANEENFYELNEWLQDNYPHGLFRVVYGESQEVCAYVNP